MSPRDQRSRTLLTPSIDLGTMAEAPCLWKRLVLRLPVQLHYRLHLAAPHHNRNELRHHRHQSQLPAHRQPPFPGAGQPLLDPTLREDRQTTRPDHVFRPLLRLDHLGRAGQELRLAPGRQDRAGLRG